MTTSGCGDESLCCSRGGSAQLAIPDFLLEAEWEALLASLRLSTREGEIAAGILLGISTELIGERLGISTHTVHTHMERLFRKLGVRSRCEVAVRLFGSYVLARRIALSETRVPGLISTT